MFCEDQYTETEMSELKEMHEPHYRTATQFVCPDCYDDLRRLPLEEQLNALLEGAAYVWPSEWEG